MATPVKVTETAIVPAIYKCISCNEVGKQKYFILKPNGEKGSSYQAAKDFYAKEFWVPDNFGIYFCKTCKRVVERILDMKMNMLKLAEKVLETTQEFRIHSSSKRIIERTPNQDTRHYNAPVGQEEMRIRTSLYTENEPISVPVAEIPSTPTKEPDLPRCSSPSSPLISLDSLESQLYPTKKQCHIKSPTVCRTDVTTYKSIKLRTVAAPVVKSLSNGSYRKAVRMMLSSPNPHLRKEALKGIADTVKQETDAYAKENRTLLCKSSETDLTSFKLSDITDPLKNTVLWEVLCAVASRNKTVDQIKLSAASLILMNAKSKFFSRFQYVVGISMYNNQLQREGYNILTKLGLTVSHSALHKCLTRAQTTVETKMAKLKKGIEENPTVKTTSGVTDEHSYASVTAHTVYTELTPDHTYNQPAQSEVFKPGYRFNIDNLDFILKVRDMTEKHQNKSHHYVQAMAVVDRVPCEHLPDDRSVADLMTIPIQYFLPSENDHTSLSEDFIHMIALILVEHLPAFKVFEGVYPSFFEHKYSKNMDQKSTVLPLGILDKSENKTNEMIDILEYLHQFVPNTRDAASIESVDTREEQAQLRAILLGGDQLTCERIRGAHIVRLDGDTPEERLEGCLAMIEDFHEKMNFLQIIMDRYYRVGSAREAGTLYQLRNIINRRNVSTNVSQNYHNASAFIDLVGTSHVIAAALEFFGMSRMDSSCARIPPGTSFLSRDQKKNILDLMLGELVDELTRNTHSCINSIQQNSPIQEEPGQDRVLNYAANILKLFLLRKVNILATRSGDGDRLLRHWKYGLLLYDTAKKPKYKLEAFLLLAGINALYTPRQREQAIWNRFISLSGGKGKNLDGDYVMELLNKYAKSKVKLIGPTHSPDLVMRIGKTMMFCHEVQVQLERQVESDFLSRDHTSQNLDGDTQKVVEELLKAQVFKKILGRHHQSFDEESEDIFSGVNSDEFHEWFNKKKQEYSYNKLAF